MKKTIVTAFALFLLSVAGSAQTSRANRLQNFRIERGFNNGQLNRAERLHVRKDQLRLHMAQKRARRDGVVTPMERRRLMMMKRKNNFEIFSLKHNRHRRII